MLRNKNNRFVHIMMVLILNRGSLSIRIKDIKIILATKILIKGVVPPRLCGVVILMGNFAPYSVITKN